MSHDTTVARRQVEITNSLGLHLRPADKFVKLATALPVRDPGASQRQRVQRQEHPRPDDPGRRVRHAAGPGGPRPDAEAAVEALADLVSARFHENENGDADPGAGRTRSPPDEPRDRMAYQPQSLAGADPAAILSQPSRRPSRAPRAEHRNPRMPLPASSNPDSDPRRPRPRCRCSRGIAVSPGIAIGPVLVLDPRLRLPPRRIAPEAVAAELDRLDRGLDAAWARPSQAEAEARHRLGPQYADILAAHARMIADPTLRADARRGSSASGSPPSTPSSRCSKATRLGSSG